MATIMIIDDDVDFADNMATLIAKHGYEVMMRHRTDDAIQALTESKPDLLVLDVMFPDNPVAGFDLARAIRRTRALKHLPVILLTGVNQEFPMGFSTEDIDSDWMPVESFIEKPVDIARLIEEIDALLRRNE